MKGKCETGFSKSLFLWCQFLLAVAKSGSQILPLLVVILPVRGAHDNGFYTSGYVGLTLHISFFSHGETILRTACENGRGKIVAPGSGVEAGDIKVQ